MEGAVQALVDRVALGRLRHVRGCYGSVSHHVKAIYECYMAGTPATWHACGVSQAAIVLRATGRKNARAKGTRANLDAFLVLTP